MAKSMKSSKSAQCMKVMKSAKSKKVMKSAKSMKAMKSRVDVRKSFQAQAPKTVEEKRTERLRLQRLLRQRRKLGAPGYEELNDQYDAIEGGAEAELQFLLPNVPVAPTAGRQPTGLSVGAKPSEGGQVRQIGVGKWKHDYFMNAFAISSPAAQRTIFL